jgi:hypothetical protein
MRKMKRRDFLKILAVSLLGSGVATEVLAQSDTLPPHRDDYIKDYLFKTKHSNRFHKGDISISAYEYREFVATVKRLSKLEQFIGHGNFQYLNFDDGLFFARKNSQIGEFTKKEVDFLEKIFYTDASRYGFLGEKTSEKITDKINKKDIIKVPYSGTYLHKGISLKIFNKIKKEIGDELVLTSGIRGVMKQFLLFLNKAYKNNGNLSLASRSLAPPGYSFHGIGDFDVGQTGFGINNFTEGFTNTDVYRKLLKHGYLTLRYPHGNLIGVRYEPWHIEIPSSKRKSNS